MPRPDRKKAKIVDTVPRANAQGTLGKGFSWILPLGLLLLVFVLYAPVGYYDFVNYDDSDYVAANPHVLSGVSRENLRWAFASGHASNWHPLTWLSHQLDCELHGADPGGAHLTSAALHVLNTALLFILLRELTGSYWRSLLVAALFALHPLRVESVAWISERKDVLSGLFFLLTLWAYQRYGRLVVQAEPRRRLWYGLALLFFVFGLLSKPMLVTVPFVLLLLDFWPLQRIQQGAFFCGSAGWRVWVEKVPFLLLAVGSCVTTYLVQREGGAVAVSLSPGARLANAAVSHLRYVGKLFWPVDLSVLYPHPGLWPGWLVACATLFSVLAGVGVWLLRWRLPPLFVGYAWFVGMLVPVIGIVQVGIQSMADRYTYLPMIGLGIALVWTGGEVVQRLKIPRMAIAVGVLTMLSGLCVCMARQTAVWRNSETLFRHAVQATERNYLAYNNLGFYLSSQCKPAEAIECYRRSLEINPNYEDALNNLGYALAAQKRYAEAIPLYRAALAVRPGQVEVHNNLGNALSETGQIEEAIEHYRFVLERNPDHANANNNYGIALAMKGRLEDAIRHFRRAVEAKPDYAGALSNLGNAYAVSKQYEAAEQAFRKAMELDPRDARARNNYANVLAERGRLPEAVSQYRIALRLQADNPEAHCNLGMALNRMGETENARHHFEEALRLRPNYPEAARMLGR